MICIFSVRLKRIQEIQLLNVPDVLFTAAVEEQAAFLSFHA